MQISDKREINRCYTALLNRNEQYIGIFFVGVKTTGVFCIATCRARKPKLENVVFYTEVKELLQHGFRPCKVCKPTENAHETPEDVVNALGLLKNNPASKVTDFLLRQNKLSPTKIRRWFKQHYGVTFQGYQRMIRINSAFQELKNGNNVTHSAFGSGYGSLSGFGYTFKKLTGQPPEAGKNKTVILITRLTTPLGPMFACATDNGICLLEFTDRRMLETEFQDLQKRLDGVILTGENPHLVQLKKELKEYFSGQRKTFNISLDPQGTDFQKKVWQELLKIPHGVTSSYQDQAIKLGNPNAVRAVASANGYNKIAIVIPCHRIIGKNGALIGYGGGLSRKQWLLNHETL